MELIRSLMEEKAQRMGLIRYGFSIGKTKIKIFGYKKSGDYIIKKYAIGK